MSEPKPAVATRPSQDTFGPNRTYLLRPQLEWSGSSYLERIERRLGRPLDERARRLASWPWQGWDDSED